MAPADTLSPPGSSSYDSNTMTVGDGTWDYTKNTFLLPNLVGLNFDTMQYNGMGNRFSTLTEYHSLITAHGVLATLVFLFIVPLAIMINRFSTRRPGSAIRMHAYLQILAVLLITVAFILGWFAVGPDRSLTNPHHGIGVAIYTLILLQLIGGKLIHHIRGRSIRVMFHQWSGRFIALLGIVQIPLGLTLYGSPKFTFVLYALWMAVLILTYFILSWRHYERPDYVMNEGRSEITRTERTDEPRRRFGFLAPLAAGAAGLAFWRHERNKEHERSRSRSRAASRRRDSRPPEVIPSRRGSESFREEDEKYSEPPRRSSGIMGKLGAGAAAIGAGALAARLFKGRDRRRDEEYSEVATDTPGRRRPGSRYTGGRDEFSDVTDMRYGPHGRRTPLLPAPGNPTAMAGAMSAAETRPGTSRPVTPRPARRTGGYSHARTESGVDASDYSSYVSPTQRHEHSHTGEHIAEGAGAGLLAGLGLNWFAKRRARKEEERLRLEEEERRAGNRQSRFTGDGYSPPTTPTRRRISRHGANPLVPPPGGPIGGVVPVAAGPGMVPPGPPGPPGQPGYPGYPGPAVPVVAPGQTHRMQRPTDTVTSTSEVSEDTSVAQPWPPPSSRPPIPGPPVGGYPGARPGPYANPPPGATGAVRTPGYDVSTSQHSISQHDYVEPAAMPAMPADPHGFLRQESGSEEYMSAGGRPHRRHSQRRREAEEAAAALAGATAARAAEHRFEDRHRDDRSPSQGRAGLPSQAPYPQQSQQPVSVKVKVHDDRDRNVTLRRLTEEEAAAARREHAARRRADSFSSMSGSELPSTRASRQRYRRDDSAGPAARRPDTAESLISPQQSMSPLSPPAPAFAGGRRPKDSAYYSAAHSPPVAGAAGPSGTHPSAGVTASSLNSGPTGSHGTWSGMSPTREPGPRPEPTASAADRARRRRQERRAEAPRGNTVDFT